MPATGRGLTMAVRCLLLMALAASLAAVSVPSASGSANLQVGIFDDSSILGSPDTTFPLLKQLRTQVIRVTLAWGGYGTMSVARRRPAKPTDPEDPAYRWTAYDDIV